VAVAESTAGCVLTAQTNRGAFEHKTAERQSLGEGPIDSVIAQRRRALLHQTRKFRMNFETGRERRDGEDDLFERQEASAGERQILRHRTGLQRAEFQQLPLFLIGLRQIIDVVEVLFLSFLQGG